MGDDTLNARLRALPAVDELMGQVQTQPECQRAPRSVCLAATRQAIEEARRAIRDGVEEAAVEAARLSRRAAELVAAQLSPFPQRVINATGIIIHTGLGRSRLPRSAVERLAEVARSHCALEVDTESGERGRRDRALSELLCQLTGAEGATAVNNNAAAVYLALNTVAEGREVLVSRGQLVEIGGSFRIPDVLAKSGAKLIEVGTTNKTRLSDYANAITENTAALLRVHMSNYRIVGFTEEVGLPELVKLGKQKGLPVIDDLGSGALVDVSRFGLAPEPLAQDSVKAGATIVAFSGDKLTGGPQAGILVGERKWIRAIRRNPLYRAMRLDKLMLGALHATLLLYLDPEAAMSCVPTLAAIATPVADLERRARRLVRRAGLPKEAATVTIETEQSQVGGGALPGENLETRVVAVRPLALSADRLARRLRCGQPSVFCRIKEDRVLLDMRTVTGEEVAELAAGLREGLREEADEGTG